MSLNYGFVTTATKFSTNSRLWNGASNCQVSGWARQAQFTSPWKRPALRDLRRNIARMRHDGAETQKSTPTSTSAEASEDINSVISERQEANASTLPNSYADCDEPNLPDLHATREIDQVDNDETARDTSSTGSASVSHPIGEEPKDWTPPKTSTPNWRPQGLLRDAVTMKKVEVEAGYATIMERPDHPVSMRMSFYEAECNYRFSRAIRNDDGALSVIAVLKRFQLDYDAKKPRRVANLDSIGRQARIFELAGVSAAMVCTDSLRYGCDTSEITDIAKAVAKTSIDRGMPLLRQDLIIDPLQIAEAAVAGAVAVNIIAAAALPDLLELLNAATAMGIEAVVECHTELEREVALESGATIFYFTNRDRSTNKLYPGRAEQLRRDIPAWAITLGGGGLATAGDAWSLLDTGFDGVILGEALLNSPRPEGFVREIQSRRRPLHNPFDIDLET